MQQAVVDKVIEIFTRRRSVQSKDFEVSGRLVVNGRENVSRAQEAIHDAPGE
jgi:hypothetical protein